MAVDYEALENAGVAELAVDYSERDAFLYALATGFGQAPVDERELPYVMRSTAPKTVPTLATALFPRRFLADLGIDSRLALRVADRLVLHRPLPATAALLATARVQSVEDATPERAAVVLATRVRMARNGADLFSLTTTFELAGRGMPTGAMTAMPSPVPERGADLCSVVTTRPEQAWLLPLAGDADGAPGDCGRTLPELGGSALLGIACRAVLGTICDYDYTLVQSFGGRIRGTFRGGETVVTEMWQDRNVISFRCLLGEQGRVLLDAGKCTLAP